MWYQYLKDMVRMACQHPVPIDLASKYRFSDEIKSRNEDEFVFFQTTFIFLLFP